MKKIKKFLNKVCSSILSLTLVLGGVSGITSYADASSNLQLSLIPSPPVDVVLTLGPSAFNATNFKTDLTSKLSQRGLDTSNLNISSITTTQATAQDTFSWQTFDHYNYSEPYGGSRPYHIENTGTSIIMHGYTRPPFKDWLFMPDTSPTKKTFTFTLSKDATDWHSMEGGGFLFNSYIDSSNKLYGYVVLFRQSDIVLDKLNGVDVNSLHDGSYNYVENASGATKLQTFSQNTVSTHQLTITVTPTTLNMTDTGKQVINNYVLPTDFGYYGYGPFTSFASHACSQLSYFTFGNIVMSTTTVQQFNDVVQQPKWTDGSLRFLADVEDNTVPAFDDPSKSGVILTRLINENINYIGLGTDTNKTQMTNIVSRNNGNGAFYYNNPYDNALNNLADYIMAKVNALQTEQGDSQYVLIGQPLNIQVKPSSLATNTANAQYPQGRWKIDHDYTYYDNNMGQASWAGQWENNLQMSFDKPGKYTIWFGDQHPTPTYVYAHRKPLANFSLIVKDNVTSYGVQVIDNSYDPDEQYSDPHKGIAQEEWKWKETSSSTWNVGMIPSSLPTGKDYIVQLRVLDNQGAWSDPVARYITTANVVAKPVANFDISPNPLSMYSSLTVDDMSYDPAGRVITSEQWTVKKGNTLIYQGGSALTNFKAYGAGDYTISLTVTNNAGLTSDAFSRPLTVTDDKLAPEAIVTPTNQPWANHNVNVGVSYSDPGGSGFKQQRYAVDHNYATPSTGWGAYSGSTSLTIPINQDGSWYVHLQASDNAGNLLNQTMGPYQVDKMPPSSPSINANSSWINAPSIPVTIVPGIDNVSGVNRTEYSLSGATSQDWTAYNGVFNITNEGVTNIYTRSIDNTGNVSSVTTSVVKIDRTNPNASFTSTPTDNGSVMIAVNATDSISGVQRIFLPNGDWVSGNTVNFTVNSNQSFTFEVEDNAGNIITKQYDVTNANKNILITNNPNVTLQLSAQDTLSGVSKMRFKNENLTWSGWEPYATTKDWLLDPVDGLKHVWVEYIDNANNISNSAEDVIILDQTAPVISSFTINNGDVYTGSPNVNLQLSATDNLTGVKSLMISNNNVNWTTVPYVTSIPWTLTNGDGDKTVYVKVVDGAGNVSSVATDNILLDMTKPLAGIVINNGDQYTDSRNVNLTLTFADSGSGIASVKVIEGTHEYTLPNNATSPTTLPWTLDYGTVRTVTIVVTDKVGNVATASATINVDKLTIQSFTLTDVVYPGRTFTPLTWSFTPQQMLSGANISFALKVKSPYDSTVVKDSVQYKVAITGTNYNKAIIGGMDDSGGDVFIKTVTIPQDAPPGAKVYVSATAQRKLLVSPYDIQTVYFPGSDSSTMALIGVIQGNIYQNIIFNETI